MAEDYNGWEVIRRLGAGAQGDVYLVRTPERVRDRAGYLEKIKGGIAGITSDYVPEDARVIQLSGEVATAIVEYARAEKAEELGALKRFKIAEDDPNAERAIKRFEREVEILDKLAQPGIVRLLRANTERYWMITEYHPGGALADQPDRYSGRVLSALEAFRPLVASVSALHDQGVVHRDIKPSNIFIAADGRLVLGDFGIVYLEQDRLTELFERVGPRDWMAPWAHTGTRVDEVRPSFDVFPLGKVLWSMVSGRAPLPYWYWDRDQYNVEKLFPDAPDMYVISALLRRCVVENEKDCLPTAKELLRSVDDSLRVLRRGAHFTETGPTYCRMCGKGQYAPRNDVRQLSFAANPVWVKVFTCNACGHMQIFENAWVG